MNSPDSAGSKKKILDVGCGWNKTPGAVGIDSNPKTHADVIHNLGDVPYPFADNEFDEIVCRHVIEHVPDVMAFVTELYRITKPRGSITIITPHYTNPDWPSDPTHRNHFNSYSFRCFVKGHESLGSANDAQRLMRPGPFQFYTDVNLRPIRVYVSTASLWRVLGIEWLINLDQRWPSFRFTRKFWEFYLSFAVRGKELNFEFEVLKDAQTPALT